MRSAGSGRYVVIVLVSDAPGLALARVVPVNASAGRGRDLRRRLCCHAAKGRAERRGKVKVWGVEAEGNSSADKQNQVGDKRARRKASAPVSAGTAKSPLSWTIADIPELDSAGVGSPGAWAAERKVQTSRQRDLVERRAFTMTRVNASPVRPHLSERPWR